MTEIISINDWLRKGRQLEADAPTILGNNGYCQQYNPFKVNKWLLYEWIDLTPELKECLFNLLGDRLQIHSTMLECLIQDKLGHLQPLLMPSPGSFPLRPIKLYKDNIWFSLNDKSQWELNPGTAFNPTSFYGDDSSIWDLPPERQILIFYGQPGLKDG